MARPVNVILRWRRASAVATIAASTGRARALGAAAGVSVAVTAALAGTFVVVGASNLDVTSAGQYAARTSDADRAAYLVSVLTAPVTVRIVDGSGTPRASATAAAPWASVSAGNVVPAQIPGGLTVSSGGVPDSNWKIQWAGANGRVVQASFGVSTSSQQVKWSRTTFDTATVGQFGAIALQPLVVPAIVTLPTISGTPQVGSTLSGTDGTWSSAVASTAWRWQRANDGSGTNTVDISGTTSVRVCDPADATRYIRRGVQVTNAAGTSAWAYSPWSGPVASGGASTSITAFSLTAPTTGTHPWAFGHGFRQGDVPSGFAVVSDEPGFQATVLNRWPDGSVKLALIAGRSTLTANTPRTITIQRGTDPGGTPVGLSALQSSIVPGQNTVSLGAFGTVDLANAVNASSAYTAGNVGNKKWSAGLVRQRVAGPTMSEWHFYTPAPNDDHLAVWWFVRRWSNGATEIEVVVENGWLKVAGPGQKDYAPVVTIGGTSRFAPGALAHYHHTRWSAVYWLDATTPEVVPTHSAAYLRSTKLVPNYGYTAPSDAVLGSYAQTWAPFGIANHSPVMGNAGDDDDIGVLPRWEALHISTADARTYRATIANARAIGRYALHYRDETTLRPMAFSAYPNLALSGTNSGIGDTSGTSPTNDLTPTPTGSSPPGWKFSHHPSPGYLPYLLTGRWLFAESQQFAVVAGHLRQYVSGEYEGRFGAQGILTAHRLQTRDAAWSLRTLAMAAATMQDDDPLRTEFSTVWKNNVDYYHSQTVSTGPWAGNLFGSIKYDVDYNTSAPSGEGGPWQQFFFDMAMFQAADIAPPMDTTTRDRLSAVVAHLYKHPVGFGGDGTGDNMPHRRGSQYWFSYLTSETDFWNNPQFRATWKAAYDATVTLRGWGALPAGTDLRQWDQDASADLYSAADFASASGWGQLMAALAYAVDANASGAQAAWDRITASPTWTSKSSGFNDNPKYGIVPRSSQAPAWLTGKNVGQWYQLANTTLPAYPIQNWGSGGSDGPVAFSGMALRASTSTLIAWGGGHADYDSNEVRALDLRADVPAWTEICAPSPIGTRTSSAPWWGTAPNQKPNVPHTYSNLVWVESRGRMFSFGRSAMSGPSGGDVDTELIALAWSGSGTATWDQPGTWSAEGNMRGRTAEADNNGNVWVCDTGQGIKRWNATTRAVTAYSIGALNWNGVGQMVLDTARNRFLRVGAGSPVVLIDNLSGTPSVTNLDASFTGSAASAFLTQAKQAESQGLLYDPINDRFLLLTGTGGEMYAVHPTTWAVTVIQPTGYASVTTPPAFGTYTRIRYVPALKTIFFQPRASASAWFMRLA